MNGFKIASYYDNIFVIVTKSSQSKYLEKSSTILPIFQRPQITDASEPFVCVIQIPPVHRKIEKRFMAWSLPQISVEPT